jgi:hypothetical protein
MRRPNRSGQHPHFHCRFSHHDTPNLHLHHSSNKFYFVVKDDNCYNIAQSNSISLDQFYAWNPAVGNDCATLRLGTYVCIATVGAAPTTLKTTAKPTSATFCTMSFNRSKGQYECPTPAPTPTRAGNGIATPTPFQAGMTTNCKKFYKVVKDDG